MTGDIKTILFNSDAAKSLLAEKTVSDLLGEKGWKSERGVYCQDSSTGKPREIDVYCLKYLDRPKRYSGLGGPITFMNLFCECKSLSGSNILLVKDDELDNHDNVFRKSWIGHEENLYNTVLKITEYLNIRNDEVIRNLYRYALDRAYPVNSRSIKYVMNVTPPPVDLIANSFRETKNGREDNDKTARSAYSPVWNAILSVNSAINAAIDSNISGEIGDIAPERPMVHDIDDIVKHISFFLDTHIMRTHLYHGFIVLDANLWSIDKENISEVNSARIYIKSLDNHRYYIDLVRKSSLEDYISNFTTHVEKSNYKSIKKMWDIVEEIAWMPGQASELIKMALKENNGKTGEL